MPVTWSTPDPSNPRPKYGVDYSNVVNPQLNMNFGKYNMTFSVAGIPKETLEWMMPVLHRQVQEIVDRSVDDAVKSLQLQLRQNLGLK